MFSLIVNRSIFCEFIMLAFLLACVPNGSKKPDPIAQQQNNVKQVGLDRVQTMELQKAQEVRMRLIAKADSAKLYCAEENLNIDVCMLVDMSVHSGKNRFFVWDLKKDTVAYSGLCCHGYGLGGTQSTPMFSNKVGSYCTSLGKYKIGARAYSNWGINVHYKLHGLEPTNRNAYKRMIVLHSYSYIPEQEIYPDHLPLGYSQGCPVIDNRLMAVLDDMLKKSGKPMLLWIYNQ